MTKMMTAASMLAMLLGAGPALAQARVMNLAFTPPADSHYGDAARAFAETIAERSGGAFEIALRPAGALGGERDVIEGMQIGTVELAISSTGPIGNFVPEVYALDFPFLFDDYASAHAVLDGEIGQELLASFQPHGIVGLAWAENGFRHITNSVRPIREPADLAGLKLRTMENEVHIAAFRAAGAAPTPMSWTEVLTSLQQGTIDGQENPIPIVTANNMWEIQDNITLTGHVYSAAVVAMSAIHWDGLTEEQQGWFVEAAQAAAAASRQTVAANEESGIALMRENGMEVIDGIDKAAFAAAVQPAYDEFADRYAPELIARIRAAQD
ncbi:C4-dicarboxylate ABC transporter substrate-binding protein [Paracoccus sp. S4493]|uniref:TRAP transporter substrate-binding protein n=1 Tax=Paracoccus sp. S4493 TaxID=579490 RepID=UPI00061EF398|nr:TRAP transporter substrate-binding protein [Paracoccus sp. S4493]KJZ30372.1 C4-dicarboxylate ABC transporter substrate-binding protein [Paracoccus sp. S4493]